MRVQTSVLVGAACLSGGIDVSVGGGAAAFLPWDATAAAATTTFNTLLGVSASEDGVHVERRGDGQSSAVFVVRHLRGGARPALLAVDGAPLHRRSYAVDWATHTDNADSAAASLEHTAPGGIELLPLPGRYLSAPTNESTVRVSDCSLSSTGVQLYVSRHTTVTPCAQVRLRLGHETTARCAAPDWAALHLGCYASSTFADSYAGQEGASRRFDAGLSLERCALHCQTSAALAAAFAAAGDVCLCLSPVGTPSLLAALPNSVCNTTCSADSSQLCGSPAMHPSNLTSHADAPCMARQLVERGLLVVPQLGRPPPKEPTRTREEL